MAGFQRNNSESSSNVSNFKKADGFLNLALELPDGSSIPVGGIALHGDNDLHSRLMKATEEQLGKLSFSFSVRLVGEANPERQAALDALFG